MGDVLLSSKLYVKRKPRKICVVQHRSFQQPHCSDGSVCHSGHPAAPPSASPHLLTHFPSVIQNAFSSRISHQEGQLGRNISAGGGRHLPVAPTAFAGNLCPHQGADEPEDRDTKPHASPPRLRVLGAARSRLQSPVPPVKQRPAGPRSPAAAHPVTLP